jgi:heat shock protein HslJ
MKRIAVALVVFSAIFSGCDDSPSSPSDIIGDTWELLSIQEGSAPAITVADRTDYTLRLTDEGRAEIRADCNVCGGPYTIEGTDIDFGTLVCTRAFCGEDSLDTQFLAGLEDAETFNASNNQLIVRGDTITLRFVD